MHRIKNQMLKTQLQKNADVQVLVKRNPKKLSQFLIQRMIVTMMKMARKINFNELEYQEKKLALKEREISLREREAKVHMIELSNLEKERELKLNSN